jgi:nucleotide-binding universal stress UspA family protein
MGTHGRRGLSRMFLGSVAEDVSRRSPCPVLLVRMKKGESQ